MRQLLLILIVHILIVKVKLSNINLTNQEEHQLILSLNSLNKFEKFYNKLIESNGIDNQTQVRRLINGSDIEKGDFEDKCFNSSNDLLKLLDVNESHFSNENIQNLINPLIYIKLNEGCQKALIDGKLKHIIIGFISIIIINLTSLFGAIIWPFRNRSIFKWILLTFIGLAVGTLVGTGVFHLIPMAFGIETEDLEFDCVFKGLLVIITVYFFYIRHSIFQSFFNIRTIISTHDHQNGSEDKSSNKRSLRENLKLMKPVGWMILISDTLHAFIDGLTIGAIAIVSIDQCIRMIIAIVCEEFSHKLGQIENVDSWICGLAGGMFIYIGLSDMVGELISMSKEIEEDYKDKVNFLLKLKIFFIENLGIILGFSIIFLLAKYSSVVSFDF